MDGYLSANYEFASTELTSLLTKTWYSTNARIDELLANISGIEDLASLIAASVGTSNVCTPVLR